MHGKGTFYYRNGKPLYEGEWKNGKFEGFGKQYSETGEYYVGEFKNNLPNGNGTIHDKNGRILLKGNMDQEELKELAKLIYDVDL